VGNLGFTEIMLIMVVVLLLFGAKRLPEVGASIGKGIREFKRSLSDTQEAIMGSDEQQRNLASRQPEPRHMEGTGPQPPNTTTGEPKRLSQ
jgi:sec-independent protein translocase protein TatA